MSDGWWFWQQCSHCGYEVPPGGTFERHLQWQVPASATVSTPAGPEPVHDDRLVSAALVALYDDLQQQGVVRGGSGRSAVIPAADPLDDMRF
jgi:hypothetical protein